MSDDIANEIKTFIIKTLSLEDISTEDIDTDAALFGEGLGLDSIDALELGVALQKRYGIKIDTDSEGLKDWFQSVRSLSNFIQQEQAK
jgi:acyl carrier protein